MGTENISEQFVKNLLRALPRWHSKLVRPFKESLNGEMSLETYYCLETLRACGAVSMTELARHLGVPKQQVTKMTDTLTAHQFVERVHKADDRRVIELRLTARALSYMDGYHLKNRAFLQSLESQLTDADLRKLNGAVTVLSEILVKLN